MVLNWITASEKSNKYFNIERSYDAKHFESIGILKAAGNSMQKLTYNFTDESPLRGTSYYRLGQVDFDGSSTYSSIIETEDCKNKVDGNFQIFPNPSNGILNVNIKNVSSACLLLISNCMGEIIFEQSLENEMNAIDVSKFNEGIYFIKVVGEVGVFTKKFIKN